MIRALGYFILVALFLPALFLALAGARTPMYLWIGAWVLLVIAEKHDGQA